MKPKIIHCCWFGRKEMPELEKKCVESWKRCLPNYQFVFWNEDTFDINQSVFCRQAYEKGMLAFVSDYVRAYALFTQGGTYFDTDEEVLPGIAEVLEGDENVVGFLSSKCFIGAGVMSFGKGHPIMKKLLDSYSEQFVDSNGVLRLETNVSILTKFMKDIGLVQNKKKQRVEDILVLPREVFYPKKHGDTFLITDETVAIHHGSGSWLTERQKKRGDNLFWRKVCRPVLCWIKSVITFTLGEKLTRRIEMKVRNILR